jgi:hypothetical protein
MLAIMPTGQELSIVKAVLDRAASTAAAAEFRHLQRMVVEVNLVATQLVIIPNPTPATNSHKIPYLSVSYQ